MNYSCLKERKYLESMNETDKSDKQEKRIKSLIEKKQDQARALKKILRAFESEKLKSNVKPKK